MSLQFITNAIQIFLKQEAQAEADVYLLMKQDFTKYQYNIKNKNNDKRKRTNQSNY